MSYDVTFGPTIEEPSRNYTSNVSGMWADAIGENLGDLIERLGKRAGDILPALERGIAAMEADPDKYRAMNPANGWGDYDGALAYLRWMRDNCRDWPETSCTVSR